MRVHISAKYSNLNITTTAAATTTTTTTPTTRKGEGEGKAASRRQKGREKYIHTDGQKDQSLDLLQCSLRLPWRR